MKDRRKGITEAVSFFSCYGAVCLILLIGFRPVPGAAEEAKPDWLSTQSAAYPADRYLTAVGSGENRRMAEDSAYAGLSRIFQAKVESTARDLETVLQQSSSGAQGTGPTRVQRSLVLQQMTVVSTDKILENVVIAETWEDPDDSRVYVLAVMDRGRSAAILHERIRILDEKAIELYHSAGGGFTPSQDPPGRGKLSMVRDLHGALRALVSREALNADLQVIDPTGRGVQAVLSLAEVADALSRFLSDRFRMGVAASGPYAVRLQGAILEGMTAEGLVVSAPPDRGEAADEPVLKEMDLMVRGDLRLESLRLQGRPFFRWTVRCRLVEPASDRVLELVSRSGREGHLTQAEAEERAIRAALEAVRGEIVPALARTILGGDSG